MERAVGNVSVVGASGVELKLIVTPAGRRQWSGAIAGVERPLGGIDIGTGDAVKLVAPDERQSLAVRGGCPSPEQSKSRSR